MIEEFNKTMNFLNIYLGFEVIIVQGYVASLVFSTDCCSYPRLCRIKRSSLRSLRNTRIELVTSGL